jgi:excisionase family DNA binding protein
LFEDDASNPNLIIGGLSGKIFVKYLSPRCPGRQNFQAAGVPKSVKFPLRRPIMISMTLPIHEDNASIAASDGYAADAQVRGACPAAAGNPAPDPMGSRAAAGRSRNLSVSQAAALCGVGRTTVGYWVRSKKLFARRVGRNYTIPVNDLLHFLVSSGQSIPPALNEPGANGPLFKSLRPCWSYWQSEGGHRCSGCLAFRRRVEECFSIRDHAARGCSITCGECRFFREMYAARIQFIHQIDCPAAVFKGLTLWGANGAWSDLCRAAEEELTGAGLETVIHPSSLRAVLAAFKRSELGEKGVLISGLVLVGDSRLDAGRTAAWVFPLREPEGTHLVLAVPAPTGLRAQ